MYEDYKKEICIFCVGDGIYEEEICPVCDGKGYYKIAKVDLYFDDGGTDLIN